MNDGYVVAMTTVDGEEAADRIARAVVESRLAACVQAVPIRSTYRWEGRVERADEVLLLCKTTAAAVPALEAAIAARHPYRLPEFVVVPVTAGGAAYLEWVAADVAVP